MTSYEHALELLHDALKFGIEPSLQGISLLCERLGNPQAKYACVQIAGTNGKSSTTRYTAHLLQREGLKVGLYTSPELVHYNERIEIDGAPVSRETFASAIERCAALAQAGESFTEFELLTAAAFLVFAEASVDYAVLEVGMGGRWDATTIANPAVSCITGIGLDHTAILGDTLGAIAAEKAGIIKPAQTVIMGPGCFDAQVVPVITNAAAQHGSLLYALEPEAYECDFAIDVDPLLVRKFCTLHTPTHLHDVLELDAASLYCEHSYCVRAIHAPYYQSANIATAILVAEAALGRALTTVSEDAQPKQHTQHTQHALELTLQIPGRFDILREEPLLMIDAAHNPQSAQALARVIEQAFPEREERPVLLLGILKDKDAQGILEALIPVCDRFAVTRSESTRSRDEQELVLLLRSLLQEMRPSETFDIPVYTSIREALLDLQKEPCGVLATGSITVAGETKREFIQSQAQ